jgi:hypothetical protein
MPLEWCSRRTLRLRRTLHERRRKMRRFLSLFAGTVLAVALIVQGSAAGSGGMPVLAFNTMAPVVGPFVTTPTQSNPIRGVNGGGLPWQIDMAHGLLGGDGRLLVQVQGLVLLDGAPVPENLRGTNPIPSFRAIVSCLSIVDGASVTTNVTTDPFPATTTGDSKIQATVSLPSPCVAPIIFVGPSATTWFSVTGQ